MLPLTDALGCHVSRTQELFHDYSPVAWRIGVKKQQQNLLCALGKKRVCKTDRAVTLYMMCSCQQVF